MTAIKTCTRCGEQKKKAEFYANKGGAEGLSPYCKACDNSRKRKPTAVKINRMRARHRAVADLIAMFQAEFDALLSIRLAEATDEAESLAATPAAKEHYKQDVVRLRPGPRMSGQSVKERIDVARCPDCIKHHDRGHVCLACGARPGNQNLVSSPSPPKAPPSGMRSRVSPIDPAALAEFNAGTERARLAR